MQSVNPPADAFDIYRGRVIHIVSAQTYRLFELQPSPAHIPCLCAFLQLNYIRRENRDRRLEDNLPVDMYPPARISRLARSHCLQKSPLHQRGINPHALDCQDRPTHGPPFRLFAAVLKSSLTWRLCQVPDAAQPPSGRCMSGMKSLLSVVSLNLPLENRSHKHGADLANPLATISFEEVCLRKSAAALGIRFVNRFN